MKSLKQQLEEDIALDPMSLLGRHNLGLNSFEELQAFFTISQEEINREESDRYDLATCHLV